MGRRRLIKKSQAKLLDAGGVQAIADMQRYISDLENFIWRMSMLIDGRDTAESILEFAEEGSATHFAAGKIHKFLIEHIEHKEEANEN